MTGLLRASDEPNGLPKCGGRLAEVAISDVAESILFHLAETFPENLPAIAAAWPAIADRFATSALPAFTDLRAGRPALGVV